MLPVKRQVEQLQERKCRMKDQRRAKYCMFVDALRWLIRKTFQRDFGKCVNSQIQNDMMRHDITKLRSTNPPKARKVSVCRFVWHS